MTGAETLKLHEAGGRIPFREGKGDKYKVRIMGWEPGAEYAEGSSALYPVAALKRDVPAAFPEGTRMRANHDGICEAGGDIRRVIARTTDEPWEEADGMYTNIRVSEQWSPYMKEYGDIIGLSISAAGELQMVENEDGDLVVLRDEDTGLPILKRLFSQEESPYNSIDFVEAPGADGRIVLALEAARGHLADLNIREQAKFANGITERNASKAVPPKSEGKEISMDEATLRAILAEAQNATLALVTEKLTPAEPKDEIKFEVVAEAAIEAGLTKSARAAVYKELRATPEADYTAVIEAKKAEQEQIRAELAEASKPAHTVYRGYVTEAGVAEGAADLDSEFDALTERL